MGGYIGEENKDLIPIRPAAFHGLGFSGILNLKVETELGEVVHGGRRFIGRAGFPAGRESRQRKGKYE